MAQVGQLTPSGGREWAVYDHMGVLRQVTVPVNCTLNHIGVWLREQTAANANNVRAAIYTTTGALLYQTSILTGAINSATTFALYQLSFAGQALSAGTYILAVAATETTGVVIAQGQNGSAGVPNYVTDEGGTLHPTFPADISAAIKTDASRQWDIYLDYSEASSSTGSMAATESGSDTFAAAGGVGSNGIRLTLRDTDTGALAVNLTGLIVAVRSSSNAGTTLYSTTSGTTNASGVYELASSALGNLGDYVYVTAEKSDHSIGALFRVPVIDLNA